MALNIGELVGTIGLDDKGFGEGLAGAFDKLKDFGGKAGVALGAIGAGGALAFGSALAGAMSTEDANAKLSAQLGLTKDESAKAGGVAGKLYSQAYGENLGEVNDAVGAVMRSIRGMTTASSEDLQGATANALNFAKAFDVDVAEAAQYAGGVLANGLATDANNAFDLITKASQQVPAALRGDLLEASDEYGGFFASLGFSGEQAFGLLVNASAKGKYGIDKTGDALKEFTLLATEMNDTTKGVYQQLGLNAEEMSNSLLAGGDKAQGAFQKIVTGLLGIKDPTAQAQAAIDLFGTPLEDLNKAEIPGFLESLANVGTGMEGVSGASTAMGQALNDTASSNLESFKRQVQSAFVDFLGGQALPIARDVASFLATNFGPALQGARDIIANQVVPAVKDLAQWIGENQTPLLVIAGLIAAVFLPHLIALGVESTIAGGKAVAAWVAQKAEAIAAAVTHSAQIALMIGRWIALAAAAVIQAAVVVGAWVAMGASAVLQAGITAAAWLGAQVRTVASLVVMAAGFVAQGAVMVASAAVTAAGVVAGWVLMGVQSLIQAGRMALAWVIAMGPVGWVIAAVIGLVALIIANWDTVVEWTKKAWAWFVDAIVAAGKFIWDYFLRWSLVGLIITYWDQIVAGVRAAVNWVLDAVGWIGQLPGRVAGWFRGVYDSAVGMLGNLLGWLRGLPGQILSALGDLGSLLLSAGGDIMSGLWNGIKNAAGWVKDRIIGLVHDIIPAPVAKALGINSPSKVMAEIGRWVPAGLAQGIEGASGAVSSASENLAGLVTANMANLHGTATLDTKAAGALGSGDPSSAASAGASGRSPVHIENFYATPEQSPHEIANDLDWASRGGGH